MPATAFEVSSLESILKKGIYAKAKKGVTEERTLKEAFKAFDANGSGRVSFKEFVSALERFGLQVTSELMPGRSSGGVRGDVMRALFDRYNTDGSESLSYEEFIVGLYQVRGGGGRTPSSWDAANGGANPWLPTLAGSESLSESFSRPNSAIPAARVRSIANWEHPIPESKLMRTPKATKTGHS
jgi:hypothetical protein